MAYQEIGALRELVGPGRALEILLEGRIMGSAEAEHMGIVSRVVPDTQVTEEAMATQHIASPLARLWYTAGTRNFWTGLPTPCRSRMRN